MDGELLLICFISLFFSSNLLWLAVCCIFFAQLLVTSCYLLTCWMLMNADFFETFLIWSTWFDFMLHAGCHKYYRMLIWMTIWSITCNLFNFLWFDCLDVIINDLLDVCNVFDIIQLFLMSDDAYDVIWLADDVGTYWNCWKWLQQKILDTCPEH